jgi:CheY-like chemotaxis protein/nitrogen-specific signal transduction histidine kinase
VTESVKAHRALQESESELKGANRRKDEFLAMLAHELRNPLAPIATAAALLKLGALDEGRVRKTSEVITRQVQHMTELVDDLLDVSRVTRGLVTLQEETLSVGSLLADAAEQVRSLMESKRQHFSVQVPDEQFFVRGDRTRLIQVFSNILNNAAKYTPQDGHIALSLLPGDEHVEVAVEDDGIGIAPALLPHIFDLFTQAERSPDRSQGGLGLGLALVKSLLELQGGKVLAHSAGAGQGSRFTVRLPRVTAGLPQEQRQEDGAPPGAAMMRVLVVDDNRDAAETLQLLLQAGGHEACIAYRAQDALTLARQTSPGIVFLDIGLPDMDGYELARRLRALPETARASLVAVTGYGQPKDKERATEAGFDHHLVKPARLADVLGLLSASSAGAQTTSPAPNRTGCAIH